MSEEVLKLFNRLMDRLDQIESKLETRMDDLEEKMDKGFTEVNKRIDNLEHALNLESQSVNYLILRDKP